MSRIATPWSSLVKTAVLFLSLAALAVGPAAAGAKCKKVHSHLFLEAEAVPTCGSEIGLCARATLKGSLKATTDFVGTSFEEIRDSRETGTFLLTGDNTFHTAGGDFYTRDAIVLSMTAGGEFAEVDTVIGGTGEWAFATGNLTATGTFVNGIGEGIIEGEICTP